MGRATRFNASQLEAKAMYIKERRSSYSLTGREQDVMRLHGHR